MPWSDERIEREVNKVRAGRDLIPDHWPDDGRVAVLLSFDVDNETVWLRNGDTSIGGLSQGEFGSRVALVPTWFLAVYILVVLFVPVTRRAWHRFGMGSVVVPVAAAVVIDLAWGRTAPGCRARKGWQQLGAIGLASADPLATVLAWYVERLGDYRRYESAGRTIFIRATIDDFLWERDYHKYPNIVVAQASAPWADAGYRTTIELNRPAAGAGTGTPDG